MKGGERVEVGLVQATVTGVGLGVRCFLPVRVMGRKHRVNSPRLGVGSLKLRGIGGFDQGNSWAKLRFLLDCQMPKPAFHCCRTCSGERDCREGRRQKEEERERWEEGGGGEKEEEEERRRGEGEGRRGRRRGWGGGLERENKRSTNEESQGSLGWTTCGRLVSSPSPPTFSGKLSPFCPHPHPPPLRPHGTCSCRRCWQVL